MAGCTHTSQFSTGQPEESVVSYGGKKIHAFLNNTIKSGFLSSEVRNELVVYVDGNKIIESPMHNDFSGDYSAMYEQDVISVKCQKPAFYKISECIVHVNNKLVGTLTFEHVM